MEAVRGEEKGKENYYCLLDTETGALRRISVEEQCENPNFIAVNWKKKILCALNESDKGIWLSSYEIQDDGFLCYLDQKDISGRGPCHICMDSDARRVFFANYISGDVGMVLLDETGHFEEEEYITSHSGKSVRCKTKLNLILMECIFRQMKITFLYRILEPMKL